MSSRQRPEPTRPGPAGNAGPGPMSPEKLESELARARSDKHFMGHWLARWNLERRWPREKLAGWLGTTPERLTDLELRMAPRPAVFSRECHRLSREHGCTPHQLSRLCRAVYARLSEDPAAAAADVLGVTPRAVYLSRGVRTPKPRLTDAERSEIRRLVSTGKSRRDVAKITGRSRNLVDRVVNGR